MKPKTILILAVIFFLLLNTARLWEVYLGVYGMLSMLVLVVGGFLLAVLLCIELIKIVWHRFKDRQRNVSTLVLAAVIGIAVLFPGGLLKWDLFRPADVFVAFQEGSANCMTYVHLKADKSFVTDGYCFGVHETTGTYYLKGDTIYFENVSGARGQGDELSHAIFMRDDNADTICGLSLYRTPDDSFGYPMRLKLNELAK